MKQTFKNFSTKNIDEAINFFNSSDLTCELDVKAAIQVALATYYPIVFKMQGNIVKFSLALSRVKCKITYPEIVVKEGNTSTSGSENYTKCCFSVIASNNPEGGNKLLTLITRIDELVRGAIKKISGTENFRIHGILQTYITPKNTMLGMEVEKRSTSEPIAWFTLNSVRKAVPPQMASQQVTILKDGNLVNLTEPIYFTKLSELSDRFEVSGIFTLDNLCLSKNEIYIKMSNDTRKTLGFKPIETNDNSESVKNDLLEGALENKVHDAKEIENN